MPAPTVPAKLPPIDTIAPYDVLVTGASGFIGKSLIARLLDRGVLVRALVRPETAANSLKVQHLRHPRVRTIAGRLDDAKVVALAVRGADVVYHLAFLYREAWAPNQDFYGANVQAARTVLEASSAAHVRRFVLSGSVSVYGWPHGPLSWPIPEDAPLLGRGSYAATKIETERLVRAFTRQSSRLEHAILRIPHVYGPGAATIEYFLSRLLPPQLVVRSPAKVVDPTLFFGRVWHFVHVDDVADGLIRAATRDGGRNGTFNIAGSYATTRAELRRILRWRIDGIDPAEPGTQADLFGLRYQLFDTSKAERLIGFAPRVEVEAGFREMIERLLVRGASRRRDTHERN